MNASELRTSKEKRLFGIAFGVSLAAWIILVITVIGIAYGILFGLFLYVAHALMIAYIKGHGIRAAIYGLNATHPYLRKRIAALMNHQRPGFIRIAPRNRLAYSLAPLLGMASPGGSAPLIMVAMVGVMAAIAIPQFEQYRHKSDKATLDMVSKDIQSAARRYYDRNGDWPCTAAELNAPKALSAINQKQWGLETRCSDKAAFVTYTDQVTDSFRKISFVDGEHRP
jgi:hypothetical protein